MSKPSKYRCAKYLGDDLGSWAVFYSKDIKGMRSPILDDCIQPVVSGCVKAEAEYHKKQLEEQDKKPPQLKLHQPNDLLNPVRSLAELQSRASVNPRYERLAIIASHNLGGRENDTLQGAIQNLHNNVNSVSLEYPDEGNEAFLDAERLLVDEINGVREIEAEEFEKGIPSGKAKGK